MEIKPLSGKDICAIIETCAQVNVRELSIGEVSIKFGPENQGFKVQTVGTQFPSNTVGTEDHNPENNDSFVEAIQARTKEDIMSTQTLMDDPMAFEEEVMNSFVYQGGMNEDQ